MSLRQVLTIYNTERQLSDEEVVILNAMRGWTEAERELFINSLSDKPQKKSSKKDGEKRNTQKCDIDGCGLTKRAAIHKDAMLRGFHAFLAPVEKSAGGGGGARKSKHASSLQQQIKNTTASRTVTGPACGTCGNVEDHPDHDTAHYLSAHNFQPAEQAAATSGD